VSAKSDLVEIAKLNGDFPKNYGAILGAILYLCSIFAARRSSFLAWLKFITVILLFALALVQRFGWVTFLEATSYPDAKRASPNTPTQRARLRVGDAVVVHEGSINEARPSAGVAGDPNRT
jgi:hypothetical protein